MVKNDIADNEYGIIVFENERTEGDKFVNLEVSSSYDKNDLNHVPFEIEITYTFYDAKVVTLGVITATYSCVVESLTLLKADATYVIYEIGTTLLPLTYQL